MIIRMHQDSPAPQAAAPQVIVEQAPPAIPDYDQPQIPGDGYIWTPGYWAWTGGLLLGSRSVGAAAHAGALWTPGYWGYGGGLYVWHPGYWGPHVGFYGGVNYGFGYGGVGFFGGEWRGGGFAYNRAYYHFGIGFHGRLRL